MLLKARRFSEKRFRKLKAQEQPFLHVAMELSKETEFSATRTQGDFTRDLEPSPTSPELRAGRWDPLSMDDIKVRQCKVSEFC